MGKSPEHWTSRGIRLDSEGARLPSPAWAVCPTTPMGPALEQACCDFLLLFHHCQEPLVFTYLSQAPEVLCRDRNLVPPCRPSFGVSVVGWEAAKQI